MRRAHTHRQPAQLYSRLARVLYTAKHILCSLQLKILNVAPCAIPYEIEELFKFITIIINLSVLWFHEGSQHVYCIRLSSMTMDLIKARPYCNPSKISLESINIFGQMIHLVFFKLIYSVLT